MSANSRFTVQNGLDVVGSANVSGDVRIAGNLIVSGAVSSAVETDSDIIPSQNGFFLGTTLLRWGIFANSINANGSVTFNNTLAVAGVSTFAANVNVDSGVLFVDTVNNRVGINNTSPTEAHTVTGSSVISGNQTVGGVVTANGFSGPLNWSNVTSRPNLNLVVNVSGGATGSANVTFTGLANATLTLPISLSSVALGSGTTGNYVASIANGAGITLSTGPGAGAQPTIGHANTSAQANIAGAATNVIQGLIFDEFGHVVGANTLNADTRYARLTGGANAVFTGPVTTTNVMTVRGGGAAANGGTLVLGHGNNTSTSITGAANSTWFFDVGADNALRLFNVFANGSVIGVSTTVANSTVALTNFQQAPTVLGNVMWHAGNDGAGSGLDSDLLDGQQGSYYRNLVNSTGVLPPSALAAEYNLPSVFSNTNNVFYGDGRNLTINAGRITDGILPADRLSGSYTISIGGNAATATRLAVARTISITGDASGSASFDGSGNISIALAVSDSSHDHEFTNIINCPYKDAVYTATTGAYTATYNNGSAGVGATLTNTGALSAFVSDGIAHVVGQRVLVKDQATAAHNGIYVVSVVGSTSVAWVLTRANDANRNQNIGGSMVTVDRGSINAGKKFTTNFQTTSTLGSTTMRWVEIATTDTTVNAAVVLAIEQPFFIRGAVYSVTDPFFKGNAGIVFNTAFSANPSFSGIVTATGQLRGNGGSKGFGNITTTTSTADPSGGTAGDFYFQY